MTTPGQVSGNVGMSQNGGYITVNFSWGFSGYVPATVDYVNVDVLIDGQNAGSFQSGANGSSSVQLIGEGRVVEVVATAYSSNDVELATASSIITTVAS